MFDLVGISVIGTGLGVAAIMALIQYLIGRLPPKELAGDHGTMQPNGSMIGVGILIAWGIGCAGLFYHLAVENSAIAIVVAIFGIVSIPILATAFSSAYDISWNTQRITGPATMWYAPFATERKDVLFDEIVAAGQDRWGNYFVEDSQGKCIRWNWFYSGYPELMYFVEDICPHLFADLDGEAAPDMERGAAEV